MNFQKKIGNLKTSKKYEIQKGKKGMRMKKILKDFIVSKTQISDLYESMIINFLVNSVWKQYGEGKFETWLLHGFWPRETGKNCEFSSARTPEFLPTIFS